MRRRTLLAAPALLLLPRAEAQTLLPVVASFSILADIARQVGSSRVAVSAVAGADVDPHGFQPRPSDVEPIARAAMLLRNGLGFDAWFDRLVQASGSRAAVVTASEGVTPLMTRGHHHDHGHAGHGHNHGEGRRRHHSVDSALRADPHAWQDVRNAILYAENTARGLAAADPAGAEAYRAALAAYRTRLQALDEEIRRGIATVPEARRVVVTAHQAFGYFGAAYGVRFLAPQGVSDHAEPSAAEVARLIRFIRAERVTAVFLENVRNPALLQRIAQESGAQVGGRLYSDALSPPDGPAPTYEAMMRHKLALLVPAMRGVA